MTLKYIHHSRIRKRNNNRCTKGYVRIAVVSDMNCGSHKAVLPPANGKSTGQAEVGNSTFVPLKQSLNANVNQSMGANDSSD